MNTLITSTALISLLAFGCAAADDSAESGAESRSESRTHDQTSTGPTMNVISRGSYGKMAENVDSGRRRAPFVEVATNQSRYEELWSQYIAETERPEITFGNSVVVFLLMPPQPTGGYGIEPKGVARSGDTIEIDATLHQPGQRDIVTQAFTAPYAVIEVDDVNGDLGKVVWINEGRPLATKMIE